MTTKAEKWQFFKQTLVNPGFTRVVFAFGCGKVCGKCGKPQGNNGQKKSKFAIYVN